ncbi:membrane bound O-acyl transferase family-domain-containing protein [Aspergillus insuetus]
MLIAAWTAPRSNIRSVGAFLLLSLGCLEAWLIYCLFPGELAQGLVGGLLPGTSLVQFHYLLFNPAADVTVPSSLTKLPWAVWLQVFVQVMRDSRGVPSPSSRTGSRRATFHRVAFFQQRVAQYVRNALIPEMLWFVGRCLFIAGTPDWDHILGPGTEYLVLGLTFRQLQARILANAGVWITVYCTLDTFDCLTLAAAVVLGDNHPEDWPPMFGSVHEAYSLRGFWSKFWHRMIRRPLIDFSTTLLRPIFITRAKPPDITFVCCVFFLSGLVHVPMDIAIWARTGVPSFPLFFFFCKNLIAILVETVIVHSYRSYRRRRGWSAEWIGSVERALGYTWVFLFLSYASPPTYYLVLRALGSENHPSLYWTTP